MVSFSLLGLQHPEPNGSRRATPTSTFQHRPGHLQAIAGIDASLKERKGDPVKAELDIAMKRIGELIMQVELLEAKTETSGPLGRRRSRR